MDALAGKDVQNQSGAVDDLDTEGVLQVALLGGGQFVVEDHRVGLGSDDQVFEFFQLAGAQVMVGRLSSLWLTFPTTSTPSRIGQEFKLPQRVLQVPQRRTFLEFDPYEDDSFDGAVRWIRVTWV